MKIYVSFIAIIIVIFDLHVRANNFHPLTLSIQSYYELNDYDTVKRRIRDSDKEELRYSLKGVLCCPAQTNEEEEYNRRTSFSSTNFVKKILRKKSDIDDDDFLCENEPQPVIDRKPLSADNYATKYTEDFPIYRSGYKVCDIENLLGDDLVELVYVNCDFLSRIDFLFDEKNIVVKQVKYTMFGRLPNEPVEECENFDLGKEIVDSEMIEMAYSQDNQNEVLKDMGWWVPDITTKTVHSTVRGTDKKITLKIETCTKTQKIRLMRKNFPEDARDYFVPQPLAPKLHFFGDYIQSTTCTHLNTAPMWNSVAKDAWKRLQSFVQKVAGQIGTLFVTSGIHGIFKYSVGDALHCEFEELQYLYNDNKVPIPEVFWTVVVHKRPAFRYVPDIDVSGNMYTVELNRSMVGYDYYGMILVMWNKVITRKPEEICDVVDCNDFGWNGVHKFVRTRLTFCCAFTKNNLEKLEINMVYVDNYENLNLNEVDIHMAPFQVDVKRNVAGNIATQEEATGT